jgi:hypothetical protein
MASMVEFMAFMMDSKWNLWTTTAIKVSVIDSQFIIFTAMGSMATITTTTMGYIGITATTMGHTGISIPITMGYAATIPMEPMANTTTGLFTATISQRF